MSSIQPSPSRASKASTAPSFLANSRRGGLTSVAKIRDAPAARATVTAMSPMMPTPEMRTLLALTSAAITVCTALPSGSKTAANRSGMSGCTGQTLDSGTTT